jgi:hypothetical protein
MEVGQRYAFTIEEGANGKGGRISVNYDDFIQGGFFWGGGGGREGVVWLFVGGKGADCIARPRRRRIPPPPRPSDPPDVSIGDMLLVDGGIISLKVVGIKDKDVEVCVCGGGGWQRLGAFPGRSQ